MIAVYNQAKKLIDYLWKTDCGTIPWHLVCDLKAALDDEKPVLTVSELHCLKLAAELMNAITLLPVQHPSDLEETVRDIHDIQNRIMARLTTRIHPEFFHNE